MLAFAALKEMALGRSWPIIALSAVGWALVIGFDQSVLVPGLCVSGATAGWTGSPSFEAAVAVNASSALAFSWLVMLLAMMLPLIWQPLLHVWDRSLAERRGRATLLFLAGYFGVWMLVMTILELLAVALRLAAGSELGAFLVAIGAAIAWQVMPVKARYLRGCHVLRPLPAFGLRADFASFRFGGEIGRSCMVACWAIMLVPLAGVGAHIPLMGMAALLMLCERYSAPRAVGLPARAQFSTLISALFSERADLFQSEATKHGAIGDCVRQAGPWR
jgi:predicted metal-binding membrane protein